VKTSSARCVPATPLYSCYDVAYALVCTFGGAGLFLMALNNHG